MVFRVTELETDGEFVVLLRFMEQVPHQDIIFFHRTKK